MSGSKKKKGGSSVVARGATSVVILHTSFQCLGTPAERYSERVSL